MVSQIALRLQPGLVCGSKVVLDDVDHKPEVRSCFMPSLAEQNLRFDVFLLLQSQLGSGDQLTVDVFGESSTSGGLVALADGWSLLREESGRSGEPSAGSEQSLGQSSQHLDVFYYLTLCSGTS